MQILTAVCMCCVQGNVFFYYGLQNFHQNLRKYMDSRDDAQMVGRKYNLEVWLIRVSKLHFYSLLSTFFLCGLCGVWFDLNWISNPHFMQFLSLCLHFGKISS